MDSCEILTHMVCHKNTAPNCKTNLPVDTRYKVTCVNDLHFFSIANLLCQINDPTQQTGSRNFRPITNQTQPAGQPNPRTSLQVSRMLGFLKLLLCALFA